jgi:hypothetical protein
MPRPTNTTVQTIGRPGQIIPLQVRHESQPNSTGFDSVHEPINGQTDTNLDLSSSPILDQIAYTTLKGKNADQTTLCRLIRVEGGIAIRHTKSRQTLRGTRHWNPCPTSRAAHRLPRLARARGLGSRAARCLAATMAVFAASSWLAASRWPLHCSA